MKYVNTILYAQETFDGAGIIITYTGFCFS